MRSIAHFQPDFRMTDLVLRTSVVQGCEYVRALANQVGFSTSSCRSIRLGRKRYAPLDGCRNDHEDSCTCFSILLRARAKLIVKRLDGHLWLLSSSVAPWLDFLDHLPPVQMTIGIVVKAHRSPKL